jgi:hypothetical protein
MKFKEVIMHRRTRFFLSILAVAVLVCIYAQDGWSIWQNLLDEHFDKDQSVPTLRWPWFTPPENPNYRWYRNARPNNYRPLQIYEDYTWGVQDFYFNSHVRQREEFPQSIWCAYTNRGDVDHPRYPRDSLYCNNQCAWAIWGPIDMSLAKNAAVSFWYWVDVQRGAQDSLSVVVTDSSQYITTRDPTEFRTKMAFGVVYDDTMGQYLTTYQGQEDDWHQRVFYLNDLRLLDANGAIIDTISYEHDTTAVYLCFVWHSNARVIVGHGGFIDDVVVAWDDGLFDLTPFQILMGYPVNEDSTDWNSNTPRTGDQVKLRFDWRCAGNGQTPEFKIKCEIDSVLFYEENRVGDADVDTVYQSITDIFWTATPGDHVVTWTLDVLDSVKESSELNNSTSIQFSVVWNPTPMFDFTTPAMDSLEWPCDSVYTLRFNVDDSLQTDSTFSVYAFWMRDTTGLQGHPVSVGDSTGVGYKRNAPRGDGFFQFDLKRLYNLGVVKKGDVIYFAGFATDNYPGNFTYAFSRSLLLGPPTSVKDVRSAVIPKEYSLDHVFPNPFNSTLTIDYSLPNPGVVKLSAFDLAGREVAVLLNETMQAGVHTVSWKPEKLSAGLYLLRLQAGGNSFIQKAVYTP